MVGQPNAPRISSKVTRTLTLPLTLPLTLTLPLPLYLPLPPALTFSMASAIISPISLSELAEIVATLPG